MNAVSRRLLWVPTAALAVSLAACGSDTADGTDDAAGADAPASAVLEPGEPEAMIAEGVEIAGDATIYKSSGLGPTALNDAAEQGTPESYIDVEQFPDGELTGGVTITEAQGLNVLANIRENLENQGYTLDDVVSMRVFLDAPPGEDRADYAGWNRAYRQYFANTNLDTDETMLVPLGTGEPAAPLQRNPTRPSRFALEVASLPVQGWLVEVEVDAVQ